MSGREGSPSLGLEWRERQAQSRIGLSSRHRRPDTTWVESWPSESSGKKDPLPFVWSGGNVRPGPASGCQQGIGDRTQPGQNHGLRNLLAIQFTRRLFILSRPSTSLHLLDSFELCSLAEHSRSAKVLLCASIVLLIGSNTADTTHDSIHQQRRIAKRTQAQATGEA